MSVFCLLVFACFDIPSLRSSNIVLALRQLRSSFFCTYEEQRFFKVHMSQDGSTQHEDLKSLIIFEVCKSTISFFQRFSNCSRPQCDISYIQTLIQDEQNTLSLNPELCRKTVELVCILVELRTSTRYSTTHCEDFNSRLELTRP